MIQTPYFFFFKVYNSHLLSNTCSSQSSDVGWRGIITLCFTKEDTEVQKVACPHFDIVVEGQITLFYYKFSVHSIISLGKWDKSI